MPDLNQALEQLRAHARGFQAIIDLAEAMRDVASIEQAVSESKARLAAIRADVAQAEADSAARVASLDAQVIDAETRLAERVQFTSDLVANAQEQARKLMAESTVQADQLLAATQAKIDADRTEAGRTVNELTAQAADLRAQVADGEAKLAAIKAQITALFGEA